MKKYLKITFIFLVIFFMSINMGIASRMPVTQEEARCIIVTLISKGSKRIDEEIELAQKKFRIYSKYESYKNLFKKAIKEIEQEISQGETCYNESYSLSQKRAIKKLKKKLESSKTSKVIIPTP